MQNILFTQPSHVIVGFYKAVRVILHLGQHGGPALGNCALRDGREAHHQKEGELKRTIKTFASCQYNVAFRNLILSSQLSEPLLN